MMDLAAHRSELLRHCYRMLGSFADAEDVVQDVLLSAWKALAIDAGSAPVEHWLMRIATNACLNELARRKRRGLPQLDRKAAIGFELIERLEDADWITPAADAALETREAVALAFLALLQRLPPRQRAVLLLKDVVGWSAAEIAEALELSLASVNSALHRARETIELPAARDEPARRTVETRTRVGRGVGRSEAAAQGHAVHVLDDEGRARDRDEPVARPHAARAPARSPRACRRGRPVGRSGNVPDAARRSRRRLLRRTRHAARRHRLAARQRAPAAGRSDRRQQTRQRRHRARAGARPCRSPAGSVQRWHAPARHARCSRGCRCDGQRYASPSVRRAAR